MVERGEAPTLLARAAGRIGFDRRFAARFGLDTDPLGAPGLVQVDERVYELVFVGRSGHPFPDGIEINALVPGVEPLDDERADAYLFAFLSWLVTAVGGEWGEEALRTTARIYRIGVAGLSSSRSYGR